MFLQRRLSVVTVAACLLPAAVAGCAQQTPPPVVVSNPPPLAPTPTPVASTTTTTISTTPPTNNTNAGPGGAQGTDADLADAVNKALHANTQMTGSRITAVVGADGVARLTGTAQNAQQKALATSTARSTPGVSDVINKVEIDPTGGAKDASTHTTIIQKQTKVIYVPVPGSTQSSQPQPSGPSANNDSAGSSSTTGLDSQNGGSAGAGDNTGASGQ